MACQSCAKFSDYLPESRTSGFDFSGALEVASELHQSGLLAQLAGDCKIKDTIEELETERNYTVSHRLQCNECKTIYFIGGCIRGPAIFEIEG